MEHLAPIYPVMRKYGVTCAPDEFQRVINLAFHKAESQVYDVIHRSMWEDLPQIFHLLIHDYRQTEGDASRKNLRVLDIGCGTGLASELLLQTEIGSRISAIDLLDTSTEMLGKARARARKWGVKSTAVAGSVEQLLMRGKSYDVILACSVLHHIPDLNSFLRLIRTLNAPSGVFLHLQDPNGDFLDDPVLRDRLERCRASEELESPSLRARKPALLRRVYRRVMGWQRFDYIGSVNEELIELGIVREPMTDDDLWRVTDIHDHDGVGISIHQFSVMLEDYELVSKRSYAFFGRLLSELPEAFRQQEQDLIDCEASNGLRIAGCWLLRGHDRY